MSISVNVRVRYEYCNKKNVIYFLKFQEIIFNLFPLKYIFSWKSETHTHFIYYICSKNIIY